MSNSLSDRKTHLLSLSEDLLTRCLAVITDIKDGIPENIACRTHHINLSAFRNLIFRSKLDTSVQSIPLGNEDAKLLFLNPSERIYVDAFHIAKADWDKIPTGIQETMELILSKFPDTQRTILRLKYENGDTLEVIGQAVGLTKERVRQKINFTLRKIGTPDNQTIFQLGAEQYLALERERDEHFNKVRAQCKAALAAFAEEAEAFAARKDLVALQRAYASAEKAISKSGALETHQPWMDMPVESLHLKSALDFQLSLRGVCTVRELLAYSEHDLLMIQGVGKSAVQGCKDALAEYGLSLRPSATA